MEQDFYATNRQKLLFMVEELHERGYENLRVFPSLSPSGTHWRCSFIEKTERHKVISSNWIYDHEEENSSEELKYSTQELADLFIQENQDFMEHCKGADAEYKMWYTEMLKQLNKDELPYAAADFDIPKGAWITTEGNKIKTLPDEEKYYR